MIGCCSMKISFFCSSQYILHIIVPKINLMHKQTDIRIEDKVKTFNTFPLEFKLFTFNDNQKKFVFLLSMFVF